MTTFTHGQRVTCTIEGINILDAKISIAKNSSTYICQNEKNGGAADDKLGYKYSWRLNDDFIERAVTNLKPAGPRTLDDIAVGDVIVSSGKEHSILMRIGDVVVMGIKQDYGYYAGSNYTIDQLKHYKYTVKQDEVTTPAPTKLTVAQIAEKLGYEVEVIKG